MVAAVGDGPYAELYLHRCLGPFSGWDFADVPYFADVVVYGEAEELVGPFDRVFLKGVKGGGCEVVCVVVCIEESLAVVEVVALCLIVVCTQKFLSTH